MSRSALICVALFATLPAQARTWYVDFTEAQFNRPDERTGSADEPFLHIGHALGQGTLAAGDVILVTDGSTYEGNFTLPAGVRLEAQTRVVDDSKAAPRLLPADDTVPIVTLTGEDERTAVVGFHISEGAARRGAGVLVLMGRGLVEDNLFWLNAASGPDALGGGIAVFDAPDEPADADDYHVRILNNRFAGNVAKATTGKSMGGAIGCRGDAHRANVLIEQNLFGIAGPVFPDSADYGGNIGLSKCDATLVDNEVEDGRADRGAGLYCGEFETYSEGRLRVKRTNFRRNVATSVGGGAYIGGSCTIVEWSGNAHSDNGATVEGGALYLRGSTDPLAPALPEIEASSFHRNKAGKGAAIAAVGPNLGVRVHGSEIAENTSTLGGGAVRLYKLTRRSAIGPDVMLIDNIADEGTTSGLRIASSTLGTTGERIEVVGVGFSGNVGGSEVVSVVASSSIDIGGRPSEDRMNAYFDNEPEVAVIGAHEGSVVTVGGNQIGAPEAGNLGRGVLVDGVGTRARIGVTGRPNHVFRNAGGLAVADGAYAEIGFNEVIDNKSAGDGGGLSCARATCEVEPADAEAFNLFMKNEADHGGGIDLFEPAKGTRLVAVEVAENLARVHGGGISVRWARTVVVPILGEDHPRAIVGKNTSVGSGGGLYIDDAGVTVHDYQIVDNEAVDNGGGVAVYGPWSDVALGARRYADRDALVGAANRIAGNEAGKRGGGLYVGEGLARAYGNWFAAYDARRGNSASEGGGMYEASTAELWAMHNCLYDNDAAVQGGGILAAGDQAYLRWNTLWGNTTRGSAGGAVLNASTETYQNLFVYNAGLGAQCAAKAEAMAWNVGYDNDSDAFGEVCEADGTNREAPSPSHFAGAFWIYPGCGDKEPIEAELIAPGELGDAPDDTVNDDMIAGYRGAFADASASFATYRDSSHAPAGRAGPVHRLESLAWLGGFVHGGAAASIDGGASSSADADGLPNLDASAGVADQDRFDDGWSEPGLPACAETRLELRVSADAELVPLLFDGEERITGYLQVFIDADHDGSFGGEASGCDAPAAEWAVADLPVTIEAGETVTVSTPAFATGPAGDAWVRLMLTPAPLGEAGADGTAPADGLLWGETEDVLVCVGTERVCAGEADTEVDDTDTEAGAEPGTRRGLCATAPTETALTLFIGLLAVFLRRRR